MVVNLLVYRIDITVKGGCRKSFMKTIFQRCLKKSEIALFILCAAVFLTLVFNASALAQAQTRKTGKASPRVSVREAEEILSRLGYWITKVDNTADVSTRHAVTAFQKVEGRARTGVLSAAELRAMRAASRPASRYTGDAHIEVDVTRQVLFVVDPAGTVTHILPVSTGTEERYFDEGKWQIAHTPRGTFRVTRKIFGVRHAPLGALYYPSYFHGGVAIHGSNSIPVRPASHGCVRIPNFAARDFYSLAPVGMLVIVYD